MIYLWIGIVMGLVLMNVFWIFRSNVVGYLSGLMMNTVIFLGFWLGNVSMRLGFSV